MQIEPVVPEVAPADVVEARAITDKVRAAMREHLRSGAALARTVRRAHRARVWIALGHCSWEEYARCEFGVSRSTAYRLLDMATVLGDLDAAAIELGMSPIGDILELSRQQAREIKGRLPDVRSALTAALAGRDVSALDAAGTAQLVSAAVDRVRRASTQRQTPAELAADDPSIGHTADTGVQRPSAQDFSELVLREMVGVQTGIGRARALIENHSSEYPDDRGARLANMCRAARASLGVMLDLIVSSNPGLSEAALQALLDEDDQL